jgi:hypothetical protein
MKEPKLSIVLATDSFHTIRPVLERLQKLSGRDLVEVILVTPSRAEMIPAISKYQEQFAAVQVVEDPVNTLSAARTAGVLSAKAPVVFLGETHSFPHADFVETTLAAMEDPQWSVVVPALCNANPTGAVSWANFLSDYGRWAEGWERAEITVAPVYNAAYRLPVLLEMGDELTAVLDQSDEMQIALQARGQRVLFDPRAVIDHANVGQGWDWVRSRFISGLFVASNRRRHWPLSRRILYVGGAFLIPIVLLPRLLPGVRAVARRQPLPLGTIPVIVAGLILRAFGEMLGYAGFFADQGERGMHEYEMHKLKYVGPSRT